MRAALANPLVRRFAVAELLLQTQFWFPVWFLFLRDQGFSVATIVLADATFRVAVVMGELPLGVVVDRVGRRQAYLALAALTVVTHLAIAGVSTTPGLFGVWLLWAVQWALTSGLGASYLYEAVHTHAPSVEQVDAFGAVRLATGLTGVVSLATAGVLYDLDPRMPFLVTAVCALLALPVVASLPPVPRAERRPGPSFAEVRDVVGDRGLRPAIWLGAVVLAFGWSVTMLFQPLVIEVGLGSQAAAAMYTGFAAAGLLAGWATPAVVRRLGARAVVVGHVVMVLAVLGTGLAQGLAALALVPLAGVGYYVAVTAVEVHVAQLARTASRATALSAVSLLGGIAIAAARPSLGLAADAIGVAVALLAWAAVGVLTVPLVARLASRVQEATGTDQGSTADPGPHRLAHEA
jgi:predicted MFS family arabinose efflux permease